MNEAGIDVISPNYRGSEGYGYRFERSTNLQTQVEDVIAAAKYAKSMHGKSRVILMGTSYGALIAATAASLDKEDIAGVVFVSMIARSAQTPSAVGSKRPLHCFHGENDPLTPDDARAVIESFFGNGAFQANESHWNVMSGEGHVFRLTRSWTKIYGSVLEMRKSILNDSSKSASRMPN